MNFAKSVFHMIQCYINPESVVPFPLRGEQGRFRGNVLCSRILLSAFPSKGKKFPGFPSHCCDVYLVHTKSLTPWWPLSQNSFRTYTWLGGDLTISVSVSLSFSLSSVSNHFRIKIRSNASGKYSPARPLNEQIIFA